MKYLDNCQYKQAFRVLAKNIKAARAAMAEVIADEVRRELFSVTRPASRRHSTVATLAAPLTMQGVATFSWGEVVQEIQEKLPCLHTVMDSCVPCVSKLARSTVVGAKGRKR